MMHLAEYRKRPALLADWFRGGMPEWRARGMPTLRADAIATAAKP